MGLATERKTSMELKGGDKKAFRHIHTTNTVSHEEWVQQENEWIKAIKKDSREAFEALYRSYYPKLTPFALRYTGSRSWAEDVVHEVFYNLWVGRGRLKPQGTLRAYLFVAVRNQSLKQLGKNNRIKLSGPGEVLQLESLETGPIEKLSTEELKQVIAEAIKQIPERRRQIFLMHREDGLTYREIAEVLDISVKTVETQMSRSLKFLRHKLADFLPALLSLFFIGTLHLAILLLP